MTSLEQMLAQILQLIEDSRATGNAQALAALVQRKEAICAALAAPEQAWHDPRALAPNPVAQRKAA
jgi:hypothetical protein